MRKKLAVFLIVSALLVLFIVIVIASAIEDAMVKDAYKEADNYNHLIYITGDYHVSGKYVTVDILSADGKNLIYTLKGKLKGDSFRINKTQERIVRATYSAYSLNDAIGLSEDAAGYDSRGYKLKTVDYTVATPDFLPYGMKIRAKGIGKAYNKIYRANNTSPQLGVEDGRLQLSILLPKGEAERFGANRGTAVLLSQKASVTGSVSSRRMELSGIIGDMEIYLLVEDVEDEDGNLIRVSNGYIGEGALAIADSGINLGESFSGTVEEGSMIFPLGSGYAGVSGEWGMRQHPIYNVQRMHDGIDLACSTGTAIFAAMDGVVTYSGWYGGYGYYVSVSHGNGLVTAYGHNSALLVKSGDSVRAGQRIALSGNTGDSTGPHLHFEVKVNGSSVNPRRYVTIP